MALVAIHFDRYSPNFSRVTKHSIIAKVLYLKIPVDSIVLVVLSQKEIARRIHWQASDCTDSDEGQSYYYAGRQSMIRELVRSH